MNVTWKIEQTDYLASDGFITTPATGTVRVAITGVGIV